jgi:hypothetical protein
MDRAAAPVRRPAVVATLLIALGAAAVASARPAAAQVCAGPGDAAAVNARALQTELMVAALTCGEQERYNQFVTRFKSELGEQGRKLRQMYNRAYGGAGEAQLNRMVTRLANEASQRNLADPSGFCTKTSNWLVEALFIPPADFPKLINKPEVTGLHGVSGCSGR